MDRRLQLQTLLERILGSRNVYFQPPDNVTLRYPAIVYSLENLWVEHASNNPYAKKKQYQVTVIDRNPDSNVPDKISDLPLCRYSRHFIVDNLHHDVFNLYY